MLKRFSVENMKGFRDKITFDMGSPGNYSFRQEAVKDGCIINNIIQIFFSHDNVTIITLPAGQNIYMLWKKLKDDDFETDIIEVLKEYNSEIELQLSGLERDDFSEVYLFFDYDAHQNNLREDNNGDRVLLQMLDSFDNETKNYLFECQSTPDSLSAYYRMTLLEMSGKVVDGVAAHYDKVRK